jgi:hypothetical protein
MYSSPSHRCFEEAYFAKGKAMFQLKAQLQQIGLSLMAGILDAAGIHPPVLDEEEEISNEVCITYLFNIGTTQGKSYSGV